MDTGTVSEFAHLVADIGDVPIEEVTPEKLLAEDLGLDSLALVEIAVAVKDRWGVRLAADDLGRFKTVQDVLDRLAVA